MFFNYNGMKLEINYKKKIENFTNIFTNMWILNNMLLNGSKKKSKEKLKNTLSQMETEIQHTKTYKMQRKQF